MPRTIKFEVAMKTPDALDRAIDEAVMDYRHANPEFDPEDSDDLADELRKICKRWFKYDECVTLNIDAEAGTCTVNEA